ncbi:MAG: beta-galactosidase trimerization domain-containing protein [Armatimonadota bacterium]
MVDEIAAYGATAMLANAGGIVAWYPTGLTFQRPNPHLRLDFLAEVTEAARTRGIRVLARLDITKGWADQLDAHPDWFRIAAGGRPVLVRELAETCFSGPYWQRFNFEILDEILMRYPVDGIFYNHYRYLTCYCPRCQDWFRAATGFAIPARADENDEAWRALIRYRYRALADYTARVKAHVQRLRPGALVTWDYELATDNPTYARDSGWGPNLTAQAEVIFSIAFDRLTRPLPKWIYQHGEQASLGRTSFRRPTCILLTQSAIFGNRRLAQPPAQIVRDIVQVAAHGSAPGLQIMGTLAQDDRKALPAIQHAFQFLARHDDVYRGLQSAAEVALVYSQRTADWYGRSDAFQRYLSHCRGCHEVLVHEHLPFDVLEHEHLVDLLHAYRLVILPNVACMDDQTAAALDQFVAGGGHLIATHDTALFDHEGRERRDFAMQSLGRRFVKRRLMQGTYLLVKDHRLLGPAFRDTDLVGLGLERPYGGFGPFLPQVDVDIPGGEGEFIFTEGSGQVTDLHLSNPVTNNVPEFSYWEGEIGTPGLTINQFGKGTAVYLPWGVGRLYHLFGVIECRGLIGRLVERALGRLPLLTDAPASVETVLSRNGPQAVLHLINSTGIESKPLLEVTPVGPIALRVRGSATAARALVGERPITVARDGDYAQFAIPLLQAFEVVVLE